jgi:hypothetical protein
MTIDNSSDASWRSIETPVELKANWLQGVAALGGNRFILAGDNGSIRFLDDNILVRPES